jgi:hypothetical protein
MRVGRGRRHHTRTVDAVGIPAAADVGILPLALVGAML